MNPKVRSSMGPRGMDKMVVGPDGDRRKKPVSLVGLVALGWNIDDFKSCFQSLMQFFSMNRQTWTFSCGCFEMRQYLYFKLVQRLSPQWEEHTKAQSCNSAGDLHWDYMMAWWYNVLQSITASWSHMYLQIMICNVGTSFSVTHELKTTRMWPSPMTVPPSWRRWTSITRHPKHRCCPDTLVHRCRQHGYFPISKFLPARLPSF